MPRPSIQGRSLLSIEAYGADRRQRSPPVNRRRAQAPPRQPARQPQAAAFPWRPSGASRGCAMAVDRQSLASRRSLARDHPLTGVLPVVVKMSADLPMCGSAFDQFRSRIGQRDRVRLSVLGPIAGQLDHVAMDFRPSQGADLVAPSPGQDQQPDKRAEGPIVLRSRLPHRHQFSIAQHPIPLHYRARLRQVSHRIDFNNPAPHAPPEQPMHVGMDAAGVGDDAHDPQCRLSAL